MLYIVVNVRRQHGPYSVTANDQLWLLLSQVGGCKQLLGPALCIFQVSKAASRMVLTNAAGMVNCYEMCCVTFACQAIFGEVLSVCFSSRWLSERLISLKFYCHSNARVNGF